MSENVAPAFVAALADFDVSERAFPTSGDILMLCMGLEQVLSDPDHTGLYDVGEALQAVFREMLVGASAGTKAAVLRGEGDDGMRRAYAMGVINMAQAFASHAYGIRHAAHEAAARTSP